MILQNSQELDAFRLKTSEFLKKRVLPKIDEWEESEEIPLQSVLAEMYDEGLLGTRYPKEVGGKDVSFAYHYVLAEEMGRMPCGAFGMSVTIQQDMTTPLVVTLAQPGLPKELIREFVSGKRILAHAVSEVSAGSDLSSINCNANSVDGGYILDGNKWMVSLAGQASHFIVLARTDDKKPFPWGLTLFLVDKNAEGVCVGERKELMGHRSMDVRDVTFNNVFIADVNRLGGQGFGYVLQARQFEEERILAAARANSMADAMVDMGLEHSKKRYAFGKKLFDHQSMRFRIAKLRAKVELSKSLCQKAGQAFLDNESTSILSAASKFTSCRLVREVSDELIQIYGASGYEEKSLPARWYRDSRLLSISTGSEEVMLQSLYQFEGAETKDACESEKILRSIVENCISDDPVAWRMAPAGTIRQAIAAIGANGLLHRSMDSSDNVLPRFRIHEILGEYPGGSLGLALATHLDIAVPIVEKYAKPELKEKWLNPSLNGDAILALALSEASGGSDLASISTTYEKVDNGWLLNGAKRYVSNGPIADAVVVLARDKERDNRYSLFLVATAEQNVEIAAIEMMGNPETTSEMHMRNVLLPTNALLGAEGQGLFIQVMQLAVERLVISIRAVAIGKRIAKGIRKHLKTRKIYGKILGDMQVLQHRLAELEARLFALDTLVSQCRIAWEQNQDFVKLATIAKLESGVLSRNLADFALQVTGGNAYLRSHEVSWDFLDCRALSLAGGTDEMMLETIGNFELTK